MRISELLPPYNHGKRFGSLRLVQTHTLSSQLRINSPVKITSPRDVLTFMEPYSRRELCEYFWILALNAQNHVIFDRPIIITSGILNSSLVHPREVFRAAIVAGALSIVLVHNHPSGDPSPSPDDRAVTEQLIAAGKLLDLPIHDHVVVGRGRYVSFAEAGLL